jgi:uncharacterized membrane protein YfhO
MGRYQDLIEFQLSKQNMQVYNMLNTKYFIIPGDNGEVIAQQNPDANGNAWFVKNINYVQTADQEIRALDSTQTKNIAIVNENNIYKKINFSSAVDSLAYIKLTEYSLNSLTYETSSKFDEFSVFSEIYYKNGWKSYIDGELQPYTNVNYVLRGMEIPKGKHIIKFKFEPSVIKTGSIISLISYALMVLIPVSWFFYYKKK